MLLLLLTCNYVYFALAFPLEHLREPSYDALAKYSERSNTTESQLILRKERADAGVSPTIGD